MTGSGATVTAEFTMQHFFAILGFVIFAAWFYLAFFHGGFWHLVVDEDAAVPNAWPSVDIIIPCRNEAEVLPRSLPSLLKQDYPGHWRIILVNDHSDDGTSETAAGLAEAYGATDRLIVLNAPDLRDGWSGKVAAMQAGMGLSAADFVLFTDADIEHPINSVRRLVARALERKLDLVSRMVKLHCQTAAEKLLIPAFVFFFALLYPFARANDKDSAVAAAAGGVMLVTRRSLDNIGGLAAIKSALIDDCSLAKEIKNYGGPDQTPARIELTLTRQIKSLRIYSEIKDVWKMIARTAYTQLRHSPYLLAGTVIGMVLLFLAPIVMSVTGMPFAAEAGLAVLLIMFMIYLPMIQFYELPVYWVLTLPIAAGIYILATIDSARLYWQGKGGQWKGRNQA